ncbi:MAG: NHL repeat-containing protein [Proteobacteria bacterium]|nr:NHL repeat-containing protein [Pseudomonadota bacterium]MBU1688474.1 NHL repeat-containing protein [Pseudomonadota bacterium]
MSPPIVQAEEIVPLRLVTILKLDDSGLEIGFPHGVFYDPGAKETYLVSSIGRITVYDRKFFPIASLGSGRGILEPQGMALDAKGNLYVCQSAGKGRPARVSIFNPAFFLVREIVFKDMPGLEKYTPRRIALNAAGEIYLVGLIDKDLSGVMILGNDGTLRRWIRPLGSVTRTEEYKQKYREAMGVNAQKTVSGPDGENSSGNGAVEGEDAEGFGLDLPSGLMPARGAGRDSSSDEPDEELFPVSLSDVKIDKNGRIYLLSRETSHCYVYNAKEEFLFLFGEKGGADRKLSNPISLAVDYDRRVMYVCDYMRHTILAYDYDTGKYIFEFGGRGVTPLWFNFPNDIAVDDEGRVLVSDLFNRRVQVMNTNMSVRQPLPEIITGQISGTSVEAVAAIVPGGNTASFGEVIVEAPQPSILPASAQAALPVGIEVPVLPLGLGGVEVVVASEHQTQVPPKAQVALFENIPVVSKPRSKGRLPAALGVYGPVAAVGLIGSWYFNEKR